jgi:hypothetical protein
MKRTYGKLKNKKALAGDAISGIATTMVIVLLLLIYIGIVFFMSEKKAILGISNVISTGEYYGEDFSLLQSFYSYLNTQVEYKDSRGKLAEVLLKETPEKNDVEFYTLVNNSMKKYCYSYFIWIPDVSYSENGAQLNPYTKGMSYDFIDPNLETPWNYGLVYRPNIGKQEVFIKWSVLKKCLGGKELY